MSHRTLALAATMSSLLSAQSPAPRPEFEVASMKPTGPDARGSSIGTKGPGRFDAQNVSIRTFVAQAYSVKDFEIYGAPAWLATDKYDVSAKAEVNVKQPTDELWSDMRLRLQSLLEERCRLKVHRETKELPVFVLTITKTGVKVKPANCVTYDINHPPQPPAPGEPQPAYCGNMRTNGGRGNSTFIATGITMSALANWLAGNTSRTVIDKTGYTEKFDAAMAWTADPSFRPTGGDDSTADTAGPSIFTALQEQLGLKLESSKGPVEVLVIDHVEKPSAN